MSEPLYRFLQTSDGVRLRYHHWPCQTAPCRGTIVVLGGRAEFMEKYHETIQEILGRGFEVFSFDWRGQGGSQRLLDDPSKGYVQCYDHYAHDLEQSLEAALIAQCPKPWFLLAHSMGAHIAMHYLGRCMHDISAAVLLAPMVNINTAPLPRTVLRFLSRWMVRMGKQEVVLPALHHGSPLTQSYKHNRLTSDPVRFGRVRQILEEQPHLGVSGVTFGWLAATFSAIEGLHANGIAQRIEIPVLLILAGSDQVVCNDATRRLAERMPDHVMTTIAQARHEILQERNPLRLQFWHAFDSFMP